MHIIETNQPTFKGYAVTDENDNVLEVFRTKHQAKHALNYYIKEKNGTLKPSDICKYHGIETLKELAQEAGVTSQMLVRWAKDRRKVFDLLCIGFTAKNYS